MNKNSVSLAAAGVVAAFFAFYPVVGSAAQWVRLNSGNVLLRDAHFDMESIKKDGNTVTVRTVENARGKDLKVKSTEYLTQFRCVPQAQKSISIIAYSEPFAKGDQVQIPAEEVALGFQQIEQKNMPLYGLLCRGNR